MARNLRRMYKHFPDDYDITPKTWVLPQEMTDFRKVLKRNRSRTFILKPDAGAQGRGIYLVRKPEDIVIPENGPFPAMVAQQYLSKPLLIDGYKFDMRIYTLIMGCDPLKIFLYKEGMGRFCTETYEAPTDDNMENTYMHLTNYSINKFNDKFTSGSNEENFGEGSKRTLSAMKCILIERGIDWDALWAKIADIIIKTMISVQPLLAHLYHTCIADDVEGSACFEILGFDIIIDHKLRPLLLEVNHSPSLTCDTPLDFYIKDNLLRSVCQLLKIDPDYKKRYRKEERARAQQRIFGNSRRKSEDTDGPLTERKDPEAKEKELEERLKWEDENIGNFTRIYPTEDSAKYDQYFIAAFNGIIGETQASISKKLSTLKKLEEQEKPPLSSKFAKPSTAKSSADRKVTEKGPPEKILPDKILPDRISQIPDKSSDRKNRGIRDSDDSPYPDLNLQRDTPSSDEADSRRKLGVRSPLVEQNGNADSSRSRGQLSSRASLVLPSIHDSPSAFDLTLADEKRDILGLTESQAQDMCLSISDDRFRNPDYQKRIRVMKVLNVREKVAQMLLSIQDAQKIAKQQSLAQKLMKRESNNNEELYSNESNFTTPIPPKARDEPNDFERGRSAGRLITGSPSVDKAGRVSVYVPMHLRKQLIGYYSHQVPKSDIGSFPNQAKYRPSDGSKGYLPMPPNEPNTKSFGQSLDGTAGEKASSGRSLYYQGFGASVDAESQQDVADVAKSKQIYIQKSSSPALRAPGSSGNRGPRKLIGAREPSLQNEESDGWNQAKSIPTTYKFWS